MTTTAYAFDADTLAKLDDRDRAYLENATHERYRLEAPQEGDVVKFADGTRLRISHLWPEGFQSTTGGRFHLTNSGNLSFSGSLMTTTPLDTLTATDETAQVSAWFFRHNMWKAHNGLDVLVPVRVWESSAPAPAY